MPTAPGGLPPPPPAVAAAAAGLPPALHLLLHQMLGLLTSISQLFIVARQLRDGLDDGLAMLLVSAGAHVAMFALACWRGGRTYWRNKWVLCILQECCCA